jgi:peptidoglycan/xylan/chitin deacetylase (PgdA/CDA1 family)
MTRLGLKIDVETLRGTREGVPRLVEILRRHQAGATFLFSLGPDRTGRSFRRVFRPGAISRYGFAALFHGTLLPAPDIGRRCADILRGVRDAGFEVGLRAWDSAAWEDGAASADAAWTERQMILARDRFREIFAAEPEAHGAAGWRMSIHAWRLAQRMGFLYGSDTRGTHPFLPVVRGEIVVCPQYPTTLPALDEMLGRDGITSANVIAKLLEKTAEPRDHVFTLHAEVEGGKFAPGFESLLEGWKGQGYEMVPLRALAAGVHPSTLPLATVLDAPVPGRSGTLATQGPAFLGGKSSL